MSRVGHTWGASFDRIPLSLNVEMARFMAGGDKTEGDNTRKDPERAGGNTGRKAVVGEAWAGVAGRGREEIQQVPVKKPGTGPGRPADAGRGSGPAAAGDELPPPPQQDGPQTQGQAQQARQLRKQRQPWQARRARKAERREED